MITPTPATCRPRPFLLSETRVCDVACTTTTPSAARTPVRCCCPPRPGPACLSLYARLSSSRMRSHSLRLAQLYALHVTRSRIASNHRSRVRQSLPTITCPCHFRPASPAPCFACSRPAALAHSHSIPPSLPRHRPAPASSPSRTDSNHGLACVHTACFFSLSLCLSLCLSLLRSTASRYLHS